MKKRVPFQRPLPSEHEKERIEALRQQVDQEEATRRAVARLRQSVDSMLRSEDGRVVWGYLFRACGYNLSSLSHSVAGDVTPLKTECKEAQRLIYLELRKLASPELLAKAEYLAEFGETQAAQTTKGAQKNG